MRLALQQLLPLLLAPLLLAAEPIQLSVQLDRSLYREHSQSAIYLKAAIQTGGPTLPKARPPINLALVVDRSGSMHGPKLAAAQDAIRAAYAQLSAADSFALLTYGSEVETLVPAQPVDQVPPLEPLIARLDPAGGTALHQALAAAAEQLRRARKPLAASRILLISDGQANKGPREPADFAALAAELAREGISIAAIGLGQDFHEETLVQLASASGGSLHLARDPAELIPAIKREIGQLNQLVARDAVLVIAFEAPSAIDQTLGRQGQISRNSARFLLGDLYAHQELVAIAQAKLAASLAYGYKRRVATATLEYTPLDAPLLRRSLDAHATASFTDISRSIARSIHPEVFASICSMEAADTIREALALYDQGQPDKALRELRRTARDIRRAADEIDAPAALEVLAELNRVIDDLHRSGIDAIDRKALAASLYQRTHRPTPIPPEPQ